MAVVEIYPMIRIVSVRLSAAVVRNVAALPLLLLVVVFTHVGS